MASHPKNGFSRSVGKWRVCLALVCVMAPAAARAEDKVVAAVVVTTGGGYPFFIAKDKGFFTAAGIDFEAFPILATGTGTAALASGDVDLTIANPSAGFYNIAANQDLVVLAGVTYSKAGYSQGVIMASNAAYAAGLRGAKDLGGRRIGYAGLGGPSHFTTILLADKYHFDMASISPVVLNSDANALAAVQAGSVDAASVGSPVLAIPLEKAGAGKIIAWTGDDAPTLGNILLLTSHSTLAKRREVFVRFLRAYLRGAALYADTFQVRDAKGDFARTPQANELLAILSKWTKQSPEALAPTLPFVLSDARFDPAEVVQQVAIWKRIKLVDEKAAAAHFVDFSVLDAASKP